MVKIYVIVSFAHLKVQSDDIANEGNDILSAKDMREALQKCPVKGTTVSVNLVNREKMQLVVNKQKNFSSFHNFQYESKGVRV